MKYQLLTEVAVKLFFLLTPFFDLSMFVTMTQEMEPAERNRIARKALLNINLVCLILYFFGKYIFYVFGITVDAFRMGAGVILMLTAVEVMRGHSQNNTKHMDNRDGDISVVPLTIPYVVGPGTIGMLLVMGGEECTWPERGMTTIGIVIACSLVGAMLCYSDIFMRVLKRHGLQILSKITGLVLAAIAAQSIGIGLKNLFHG